MRAWGLLTDRPSVLDVGCGIGQYSTITDGRYLGIDGARRYVEHAVRRYGGPNRAFRCADVATLRTEGVTFDLVLMVDLLHHLPDAECGRLLATASALSARHVVSFEPVAEQLSPLGRWIVAHDRGRHVRPVEHLHRLLRDARLPIVESRELWLGPIRTWAILMQVAPGEAAAGPR